MVHLTREEVFSPDEIACVHIMNRAVRRCFLLGDDPVSGKNFDHRKTWMEKRLEIQAAYFGIDLLRVAVATCQEVRCLRFDRSSRYTSDLGL